MINFNDLKPYLDQTKLELTHYEYEKALQLAIDKMNELAENAIAAGADTFQDYCYFLSINVINYPITDSSNIYNRDCEYYDNRIRKAASNIINQNFPESKETND